MIIFLNFGAGIEISKYDKENLMHRVFLMNVMSEVVMSPGQKFFTLVE